MEKHKNLGRKIKQLRIIKNYSQEYMADLLGVSQGAYSNIEKKDGDIPHDRLLKIAEIFGVSMEDIENVEMGVIVNITNNSQQGGQNGYINHNYADKTTDELLTQTVTNLAQLTQTLTELVVSLKRKD